VLSAIESYSQAIYAFLSMATTVRGHTIRIYPRGAWVGVMEGRVEFGQGVVLHVYERLDFARQRIAAYSYEVWQSQQQLYWYDPWEHPEDASLASSFPHHKHVPPDIKHHRVPAPHLSFTCPNLPSLIEEIERQVLQQSEA
jgi:hypothetical protein